MLITYIVVLFYVTPFVEWSLHRYFHQPPRLEFHRIHHMNYHNNKSVVEYWPIPVMGFFYYYGYFLIFLGFLKYWIYHNMIHQAPALMPNLSKHHILHHKYPKYNFAVSSTLPDRVMGTFLNRDPSEKVVKI